jgi:chaperone required for assembly of F1-ATPase
MHEEQDAGALQKLAAEVDAMTPFQLTGFHDLVSLTGSLVLGLAAAHDWRDPESIWLLSRVDEIWQIEQWGDDEEASHVAERKWRDFQHAKKFFDFSGVSG